jgi:hypothetical protein
VIFEVFHQQKVRKKKERVEIAKKFFIWFSVCSQRSIGGLLKVLNFIYGE